MLNAQTRKAYRDLCSENEYCPHGSVNYYNNTIQTNVSLVHEL